MTLPSLWPPPPCGLVRHDFEFLPLKDYPNIVEANALRIDWRSLFVKTTDFSETPEVHLPDYIMGNPPFIGYSLQTKSQKEDILSVFVDSKGKPFKSAGKIDYVAGWYY